MQYALTKKNTILSVNENDRSVFLLSGGFLDSQPNSTNKKKTFFLDCHISTS